MGKLETFLLEKGALIKFKENLGVGLDYEVSWETCIGGEGDIIDCSFIWSETPEGHMYWKRLNHEFNRLYHEVPIVPTPSGELEVDWI